jgi:hypothetical protein
VPPVNREHLVVDPPAGDLREGHDRSHSLRQVCMESRVFWATTNAVKPYTPTPATVSPSSPRPEQEHVEAALGHTASSSPGGLRHKQCTLRRTGV